METGSANQNAPKDGEVSIGEELAELVKKGLIKPDGTPIKCHKCGSTKPWKQRVTASGSYGPEEYYADCQDCGQMLGYWAYGYWQA